MNITIDNQTKKVKKGETILDAAERHGIYIPHLCSHPELTPYGGCRLCIVEVDGIRGFPTACTTQVNDGMVVRTHSETIQNMRKEIIQLILSDHPVGCLICEEEEACSGAMSSIRKVGATTGCRWCPKDKECELQRIVNDLDIKEVKFPIYYQDFPVERYDPFFDRDYNLCIYCGRCVRICQEHRLSHVITKAHRGKDTEIGPAFKQSHIDAECEFCGACVSVCPTGAMSEKGRKWWGRVDSYKPYICSFCGLHCDIQVGVKNGQIVGTLPPGNPSESGGELCVKGRFALGEWVNHPDRVLEPQYRFLEGYGIVSWQEAVKKAAEKISTVSKNRTALYLSPNLTLEEFSAAKIFAEKVLKTTHITSSILHQNLNAFQPVVKKSVPLTDIEKSDCMITLFLNGNYNYGPTTLAVKRAADRGIPYFQVGWFRDTTSRFARARLTPPAGKEKSFLKKLVQLAEKGGGGSGGIKDLIATVQEAKAPLIILGPEILDLTQCAELLCLVERFVDLTGAKLFAVNAYGNLNGLLSLIKSEWNQSVEDLIAKRGIDLLYLVGDAPFEIRPEVEFIIQQSTFPPAEELRVDLLLPASTWGEITGSYAGMSHERKMFKAAVRPPGDTLSHIQIFSKIATAGGHKGLIQSQPALTKALPKHLVPRLPISQPPSKRKAAVSPPNPSFPFLLIQEKTPHIFYNTSLNQTVPGMEDLVPVDTVLIHPGDAGKLDLGRGEDVHVSSARTASTYPLLLRNTVPPGYVYLVSSSQAALFESNPCPVHLRRQNV